MLVLFLSENEGHNINIEQRLRMFKTNSYFQESCNYSFREDAEDNKENDSSLNCRKKETPNSLADRLEGIERMLARHYEMEKHNRRVLRQQWDAIAKIEKQVSRISRMLGNSQEVPDHLRIKPDSKKTSRNPKNEEKPLLTCIEERKKVIAEELTKRINDQLEPKGEKRPLKFFIPSEYSIL
jgi:hypothetical protein